MTNFQLVATSAMGLESVVAEEVKALGYETRTENGKIFLKVMKERLPEQICG